MTNDELQREYERNVAELGDDPRSSFWPTIGRAERLYERAFELMPFSYGDTFLDVGSGIGLFPEWFLKCYGRRPSGYVGVEPVVGAKEIAQRKWPEADLNVGFYPDVCFNVRRDHVVLFGTLTPMPAEMVLGILRHAMMRANKSVVFMLVNCDGYAGKMNGWSLESAHYMVGCLGAKSYRLEVGCEQELLFVLSVERS